jgi:hypothetical protein
MVVVITGCTWSAPDSEGGAGSPPGNELTAQATGQGLVPDHQPEPSLLPIASARI